MLPQELKTKIERSVYNRRKRKLHYAQEEVRQKMTEALSSESDYFIVDSMPLEIGKLSRNSRSKICKESEFSYPEIGYCASHKMDYYGYKIHAVCTVGGVFQTFDISGASVHDIHYLKDIKTQLSHCVILGDKGYLSAEYPLDLFTSRQIT